MTDYNDGKWHGWNGGVCPVHPESVVEYLWNVSGGVHHEKNTKACECRSAFIGKGKYYMIAFRVVKEYKEPREFWIGFDGRAYTKERFAPKYCGFQAIHVREVIE